MSKLYAEESGFYADPLYVPADPALPVQPDPIPTATTPAFSSPYPVVVATDLPAATPRAAETLLPVPALPLLGRYSAADYAAATTALLPRGRAWPTDADSIQQKVMLAIGATLARMDAMAGGLLATSVPGTATSLLPEWEASLGLPDACAGPAPTIPARLDQVRGRFAGLGGASRPAVMDYAAALGFTISIHAYRPGAANLPAIGLARDSIAWMFVWGVRVEAITGALPVEVLMCELASIKPAETTLLLLHDSGATIY